MDQRKLLDMIGALQQLRLDLRALADCRDVSEVVWTQRAHEVVAFGAVFLQSVEDQLREAMTETVPDVARRNGNVASTNATRRVGWARCR